MMRVPVVILILLPALSPAQSDGSSAPPRNARLARTIEGLSRAKVSVAQATEAALARIPGIVRKVEFEVEPGETGGLLIQEVTIWKDGMKFQIDVDATTGSVLDVNYDGPIGAHDDPLRDGARMPAGSALRADFETAAGASPTGFSAAETMGAGKPATWKVENRDHAPTGRRVLTVASKNVRHTYSLLLSDAPLPRDVRLAAWIFARAGEEEQGGGLVWRARDGDHYYVARWSPKEKNLRAYKVEGGRRSAPLASVDIDADPAAWHSLEIVAEGPRFSVIFDGIALLSGEDASFGEAGRAGPWIKADAVCDFDGLVADPPGTR